METNDGKTFISYIEIFSRKNQAESQQQRDEIKRLRKQALFVCKEVPNLKNMHKIAEYKETTRIQELKTSIRFTFKFYR